MKRSHKVSSIALLSLIGVLFLGLFALSTAAEGPDEQGLVDKARVTLDTFMADPDMGWLHRNLKDAKGLLIVPSLVKAGFVWGGSGGHGVLLARDEKTGRWSEPAFYSMGSVSWGLQIGFQKAEVIMFVRTQRGLESLYRSSVKLGGDTSVAAGPVGVGAAARNITVDIISFTRAKGAFAGLSLEGAIVQTRDKLNHAYYGKSVRPVDILVKREVSNPKSADLRTALAKATKKADAEVSAKKPSQFVYAKTTCNIRRGPGTQYSIIRKATKGEKLEYVSLEGNWYRLKAAQGKPQEWVHESVVILPEESKT